MNNYEYLKTLTMEEMVAFLSGMCNHYDNEPCRKDISSCDECWRVWLNKETKQNE